MSVVAGWMLLLGGDKAHCGGCDGSSGGGTDGVKNMGGGRCAWIIRGLVGGMDGDTGDLIALGVVCKGSVVFPFLFF